MKRSTVAWGLAGIGCAGLLMAGTVVLLLAALSSEDGGGGGLALGGRVGVADLEGVILTAEPLRETLAKFRSSPTVKAVVVRVNSPGGGVAASQEIHREILRFRRETGRPLAVSMEGVAASGGYYASAAAEHVFANPGTITGSIGVILQWVNYGDLLDWAKLRPVTFKSGALKDAGNPSRPLTEEERAYFQDLIDRMRAQFQKAVSDGRGGKLAPGALERMSDGRVVTGEEALALGLVDEIGDLRDAIDWAARRAGLSLPAAVWHPKPPRTGLLSILSSRADETVAGRLLAGVPVGGGWNAYYLW